MKLIPITSLSLLSLLSFVIGLTLDDLVNPLALSITESVGNNLTAIATTLIPKKTGHKFAPVQSIALNKVHKKFKEAAPKILKAHSRKILKIRQQFRAGTKRQFSLARVESLLTLRDLQVKLFSLAHDEMTPVKSKDMGLIEKRYGTLLV
jgi:hypothetical protein